MNFQYQISFICVIESIDSLSQLSTIELTITFEISQLHEMILTNITNNIINERKTFTKDSKQIVVIKSMNVNLKKPLKIIILKILSFRKIQKSITNV